MSTIEDFRYWYTSLPKWAQIGIPIGGAAIIGFMWYRGRKAGSTGTTVSSVTGTSSTGGGGGGGGDIVSPLTPISTPPSQPGPTIPQQYADWQSQQTAQAAVWYAANPSYQAPTQPTPGFTFIGNTNPPGQPGNQRYVPSGTSPLVAGNPGSGFIVTGYDPATGMYHYVATPSNQPGATFA